MELILNVVVIAQWWDLLALPAAFVHRVTERGCFVPTVADVFLHQCH